MINDTLPVTMNNNESDANNFFIDALTCPLLVTNTADVGYASLRYCINCANPNDTIRFYSALSGFTHLAHFAANQPDQKCSYPFYFDAQDYYRFNDYRVV
jgi:hypothetical protein